jgi:SAM-dependent methyltransferase
MQQSNHAKRCLRFGDKQRKENSSTQYSGLLSPWVAGMRAKKIAGHIPPKSKVLDVGCGAGLLIQYLPAACSYVGVDQDVAVIEANRRIFPREAFQVFDILTTTYPFQEQSFDTIVMAAVIEHIHDPLHVMKELFRILKPGGRLIMTTPSPVGGHVHTIMAFLGLLSHQAAEEHKGFHNFASIKNLIHPLGFILECYIPFQFRMNQLFIVKKAP